MHTEQEHDCAWYTHCRGFIINAMTLKINSSMRFLNDVKSGLFKIWEWPPLPSKLGQGYGNRPSPESYSDAPSI